MNVPRAAGLSVAGAGALGVVVGVALPWARTYGVYGDDVHFFRPRPDTWVIVSLVLLVPVFGAARAAFRRFDQRTGSVIAALTALVGGLLAMASVDRVYPAAGVTIGGPLTTVGAFTAALGWVLVAVFAERSLRNLPRPWLVAAGVAVALLATDVAVVHWAMVGRFIDDGSGSATAVPAAVSNVTGERWHRSAASRRVLGVAGAQLFTTDASAVRAYATQTGKPTWHYGRSDLNLHAAVLVDGAVVTAHGSVTDLLVVTAHDAATGKELFSTTYRRNSRNPITLVAAGHLAVLSDIGYTPQEVVAFDARSGAVRWRYSPGYRCGLTAVAATGDVLAIAGRCQDPDLADTVFGLSTTDGRPRWTWRPPATTGQPLTMDGADRGLLVRYGAEPRTVVLLGADGVAGSPFDEPDGFRAASAGAAFYYETSAEGGVATAVSLPDGARLWQVKLPSLARRIVDGTALTDQRLYLALSGLGSGPVRVLAIDRTNGSVVGTHELPCADECLRAAIGADANSVVVSTGDELVSLS